MDGAEVRAFLDVAAGDRLSAIWRLALTTGLRRGSYSDRRGRKPTRDRSAFGVKCSFVFGRSRHSPAARPVHTQEPARPARHSYAELALSGGVRLVVVSRTLGHSSSAFTADQHSHYSDEAAAEADRIGAVLRR